MKEQIKLADERQAGINAKLPNINKRERVRERGQKREEGMSGNDRGVRRVWIRDGGRVIGVQQIVMGLVTFGNVDLLLQEIFLEVMRLS